MTSVNVNVQGSDEVRRRFQSFLNEYVYDASADAPDDGVLASPGVRDDARRNQRRVYVEQLEYMDSKTTLTVDFHT